MQTKIYYKKLIVLLKLKKKINIMYKSFICILLYISYCLCAKTKHGIELGYYEKGNINNNFKWKTINVDECSYDFLNITTYRIKSKDDYCFKLYYKNKYNKQKYLYAVHDDKYHYFGDYKELFTVNVCKTNRNNTKC